MKRHSTLAAVGGIALLAAASMTLGSQEVVAADHAEAPGASADPAADIADLYAWHTEDGKVVAIITFAGLQAAGAEAAYDRDVLYTLHIDNTASAGGLTVGADRVSNSNDNESDIQVNVRFGQNYLGDWGVQVENMPGTDGPIQGAVATTIDAGDGNLALAGTFDDPFSFDFEGYGATIMNAMTSDGETDVDLAFGSLAQFLDPDNKDPMPQPAPDFFVGTNVHAIVLEFDMAAALNKNPDGLLQLWATTSRISE
ncbi:MAG: DUF4331 family protein [Nannocystaceae bacterium]|nr:DUF4331 domain-containing protein [bacterium]